VRPETGGEGAAVPDPAVPQDVYDEAYYLEMAEGHEAFAAGQIAGRFAFALTQLEIPEGGTLVDIGCGRGELVFAALDQGAGRAVGIEYAEAALAIARKAAGERGYGDRAEFIAADARAVPLPDDCADGIAMLDVIEHLTPEEQPASLTEIKRLLKPGGRFVMHTFPNRNIYETYGRIRRFWPGGRKWPEDARSEEELQMHVGEVTVAEFRDALRTAGFTDIEVGHTPWIYTQHMPTRASKRFFTALAKFGPTEHLAKASVLATARR
jgi:cyclopropane fatty-acyl-phospholipid synthase-like methyltransferase